VVLPDERQPVERVDESSHLPPPGQGSGYVGAEPHHLPSLHLDLRTWAEEVPEPYADRVSPWLRLNVQGLV